MLNFRLEGNGPPLLLLHGWGVTFTIWKNLTPLLAPHFQLVMVELPGFGESPVPDPGQPYFKACTDELEKLRQSLGIRDWAVLSYSVGTRVGEAYLNRYPDSVSTVIYLCPMYTSSARIRMLDSLVKLDRIWPDTGDWILSGWRVSFLIRALGFNGRRHPYARDWQREIDHQPGQSLKVVLREVARCGNVPFSPPVKPAIYIWGKKDHVVMGPRRPGSVDCTIHASHSAPMLAAPQIAEVVVRFLSSQAQKRQDE